MTWLPSWRTFMVLVGRWPRELEADLQQYYNVRLVDVYRRDSGVTWRQVMVLTDQLPPSSRFRAAATDQPPITGEQLLLMELWEALAGEKHHLRDQAGARRKAAEAAEREAERQRQAAAARERNAAAMEAQRRRMAQQGQ